MKKIHSFFPIFLLLAACLISGCSDDDDETIKKPEIENPDGPTGEEYITDDTAFGNFFAYNTINDIYLWKYEIANSMKSWKLADNPIKKVKEIRYKENGKDVDRWTQVTNNFTAFTSGVDGVETTYGYNLRLYWADADKTFIVAVVTQTYADSPARKAGLRRGDTILTVNGKKMTANTYEKLADELLYSQSVSIGISHGETVKEISLNAIKMYEDPVLLDSVYDVNGKKVAYLAYSSFTLNSNAKLIDICKKFKQAGASELILDLRYNGGGYVITQNLLTSMLAPQAEVQNQSVFETEIWNKDYMEYFKERGEDLETRFTTKFEYKHNGQTYSYNTSDANIGINKIYALVTESSASASESLLVDLIPYMDIEIIGTQTHGKYCTGNMIGAKDWYESMETYFKKHPDEWETWEEWSQWKKYMKTDWGIYVMISRYGDKNGENPCMPNGLTPNTKVEDNPFEPYQLGDENEAMLKVALTKAGKVYPASGRSIQPSLKALPEQPHDVFFGKLIALPDLKYIHSFKKDGFVQ